jgi:predicted outer membrane repeat protein
VLLQSPYGGAINGQEEGGFVKIRSCRFWNNSASDKGGAIHMETRTHLLDVQDTEFDTNMVGLQREAFLAAV